MSRKLHMVLPIYAGVRKKYLLSLNWLQSAHYRARNTVKQDYHIMIGEIIPKGFKLNSPLTTHYKLFYKNKKSDAPNIVTVIDKFLMDALQEHNIIDEDNVVHYVKSSWEVIEQDRDNPRVEVLIEGI